MDQTEVRPGTWIEISYLDALGGGSGSTRLYLVNLSRWLDAHPGYLIRKIEVLS